MIRSQGLLAHRLANPTVAWSDSRLVRECLAGNERAWAALVGKYKALVYSIPLKYGARPEDAADIFQAVCLELFAELPRVRNSAALRSWLMTVTAHLTFHWKEKHRRTARKVTDLDEQGLPSFESAPADVVEQVEREQLVREAVAQLPARCREIIQLLFYEHPPVPYRDLAKRLGLATGSIGFIRGRCLKRLHRELEEIGL